MATYPSGVASFTTKTDGVSTVVAADPNNIQAEVVALETYVGINPNVSKLGGTLPTYNGSPTSGTFGSLAARIDNVESGLTNALKLGYTQLSQTTVNSSGTNYSTTIAVSDYTYKKLVITVEITSWTSGGATTLKVNNSGSGFYGYDFSRVLYSTSTNAGTMDGTYQGNGGFTLGSAAGTMASYTIELPNYWSNNSWKTITSIGNSVFLTGVAEDPNRISNLYLLTTGTFTYTLTVYGVR